MKLITYRPRIVATSPTMKQCRKSELSQLMGKISFPYIRELQKSWPHLKGKLQPKLERDASTLEKVAFGQFAWCFVLDETFLVELQQTSWKEKWMAKGQKPRSSSSIFLADRYLSNVPPYYRYDTNDLTTVMELLEQLARKYSRSAFFLIEIAASGTPAIRAIESFELLGRVYSHIHCAGAEFDFQRLEGYYEHEWCRMFDEELKAEMARDAAARTEMRAAV